MAGELQLWRWVLVTLFFVAVIFMVLMPILGGVVAPILKTTNNQNPMVDSGTKATVNNGIDNVLTMIRILLTSIIGCVFLVVIIVHARKEREDAY